MTRKRKIIEPDFSSIFVYKKISIDLRMRNYVTVLEINLNL